MFKALNSIIHLYSVKLVHYNYKINHHFPGEISDFDMVFLMLTHIRHCKAQLLIFVPCQRRHLCLPGRRPFEASNRPLLPCRKQPRTLSTTPFHSKGDEDQHFPQNLPVCKFWPSLERRNNNQCPNQHQ